jgi:hypothetical protein
VDRHDARVRPGRDRRPRRIRARAPRRPGGALEGFESTASATDSRPLPTLVRLLRKDGSWLQAEIIGTNHLDDGDLRGLLLNIRDVSSSMRTDAALGPDAFAADMLQRSMFDFMDDDVRAEADTYFERRAGGVAEEHDFRLAARSVKERPLCAVRIRAAPGLLRRPRERMSASYRV